jgi:hypothetical protein
MINPYTNPRWPIKHQESHLYGAQDTLTGYWDDLRFPAQALKLSGVKPPAWTAYKGSQVLAFSDQAVIGNEEYIYFVVQITHDYKEGSDIVPHIHWAGEDNTAGNVYWRFTYSWANINAVFPAETPIYSVGANGITDNHNYATFTALTGSGKSISSMLLCSLSRYSSNALDTFNAKLAYLLEIDFHIQKEGLGSRQETVK